MRLLLILLLFVIGCKNDTQIDNKEIRSIYWNKLQPSEHYKVHRFPGVIYSKQHSDLSFETSGKLTRLNATEGQFINQGDLIAVLDNEAEQLKLLESKSKLASAQSKYIQIESEYSRIKALFEQNLASQTQLEKIQVLFNTAKSDFETRQHLVQLCQKQLNNTYISAPYSGIISKRYVENNQVLNKGEAVVKLDGSNGLQVKFYLPEYLRKKITIGDILFVLADNQNTPEIKAEIVEISNPNLKQNAFYITLSLQDLTKNLFVGMSVQVRLKLPIENRSSEVFKVPFTAIESNMSSNFYVFVFNKESSRIHKVPVKILESVQNSVLVTGQLNQGDIIASAGVSFLQDNQTVYLYQNYKE